MTPLDVRCQLVLSLGLDLIGPDRESELLCEVLPQAPSRWYLTGFLVPIEAAEDQKSDEAAEEGVDEVGKGGGVDDDAAPEPAAARRAFFPSSMGLSLLVPKDAKELHVLIRWGDYRADAPLDQDTAAQLLAADLVNGDPTAWAAVRALPTNLQFGKWQRTDRVEELTLKLPTTQKPTESPVPNSDGLKLALSVRPIRDIAAFDGLVPRGTRSVSLFLVNRRKPRAR